MPVRVGRKRHGAPSGLGGDPSTLATADLPTRPRPVGGPDPSPSSRPWDELAPTELGLDPVELRRYAKPRPRERIPGFFGPGPRGVGGSGPSPTSLGVAYRRGRAAAKLFGWDATDPYRPGTRSRTADNAHRYRQMGRPRNPRDGPRRGGSDAAGRTACDGTGRGIGVAVPAPQRHRHRYLHVPWPLKSPADALRCDPNGTRPASATPPCPQAPPPRIGIETKTLALVGPGRPPPAVRDGPLRNWLSPARVPVPPVRTPTSPVNHLREPIRRESRFRAPRPNADELRRATGTPKSRPFAFGQPPNPARQPHPTKSPKKEEKKKKKNSFSAPISPRSRGWVRHSPPAWGPRGAACSACFDQSRRCRNPRTAGGGQLRRAA